jgi:nucleoid DNA-binding protein
MIAVILSRQMKKSDLARDIAKRQGMKSGAAADEIDRAITRIIRTLRRGHSAHLPGLGTIGPGKPWTFRPDQDES